MDRASDLRSLEAKLRTVPAESLAFHAERNHFSKWLKARTEFALAHALRPRRIADFGSVEGLRRNLVDAIGAYRRERGQAVVADFDREAFDGSGDFHRIGAGSLGGKARGLAFVRRLLAESRLREELAPLTIGVPSAVVLGTDVFDRFLEGNELGDFAVQENDEAEIERRFLAASFPREARADLRAFLEHARHPLAVRSSSLLEDSQYHPFTGVYDTFMLPNDHASLEERLEGLLQAVTRVYASTFSRRAKAYLRTTPYRVEEEKMAVVVQRIVGAGHGGRYYPDFAGVARSHNFYPVAPLKAEDGIAAVALGLGREVVEGGNCLRFCPRHPQHLVQFSSVPDMLRNSQRGFWALELGDARQSGMRESRFELDAAETDGTLAAVASTYSAENDAVYDGIARPGVRLVSFAPVLKHGLFPLAAALDRLLAIAAWGMGAPVEVEFAVTLGRGGQQPELGVLQLRPLAISRESEDLELGDVDPARVLCRSSHVLGNGRVEGVRDVVVVDALGFDRAATQQAAEEVARVNADLSEGERPYLLIGAGRWGSSEPWLGIPVAWEQISGARVIVEAGFEDLKVSPSQGSHFFQNLTSFNVGYFTVNPDAGEGFVDWAWLRAQPAAREAPPVRHLRLAQPLEIRMNGRRNEGVVLKP